MTRPALPLVVVTPIYEDLDAAGRLFSELSATCGRGCFVIAVDDGSVRQPVGPEPILAAGLDGVVLRLKRNVGHQRAIAIGMSYAAEHLDAERYLVLDSDGEDMPQSVPELERALAADAIEIVVARRRNRVETLVFRAFYLAYRLLFSLLTGRSIAFGNFMMMKRPALQRMVAMQELWIHVAACVLTSRLRVAAVPLDRGPRYAGNSRMNFVSLVLHGFKAVMVFAEDVLVRVGLACASVAALSVLGMAIATVLKVVGFATPGWFSVALGIMLLVFMQTGTLILMTLMLTGVVRSGSVASVSYGDFIAAVLPAYGLERNAQAL